MFSSFFIRKNGITLLFYVFYFISVSIMALL